MWVLILLLEMSCAYISGCNISSSVVKEAEIKGEDEEGKLNPSDLYLLSSTTTKNGKF